MDTGGIDGRPDALDTGGACAASCASTASAISAIQPDIDLEGLGVGDPLDRARDWACESTHSLDQQTAVKLRMRHALHKWKTGWRPNHICWDKEIVKTVQPQLRGNCRTWNTVEVSFATLETHVLGDNRLPMCQRHQTDIRTSQQPLLTARSTIWRRRNGNNDVTHNNGLIMQCTRATNSIDPSIEEGLDSIP